MGKALPIEPRTIDEPGVRLAARLDPLAELAAVGDQMAPR